MPGFNKTGPMGAGPMTGGARGRCNPAAAGTLPPFAGGRGYGRGPGCRRGFRGGYGRGMGDARRYGWYPPAAGVAMDASAEIDVLRAQADYLKSTLDAVTRRIQALGKKTADEEP